MISRRRSSQTLNPRSGFKMCRLLKGAPVAGAINEHTQDMVSKCKAQGRTPTMMTLRIGDSPSDVAYENSLSKKAAELGIKFESVVLESEASQEDIEDLIANANMDPNIDGIMFFRPLPKHLDENAICNMVDPAKDVDGVGAISLAGVFMDDKLGFAPATARACIEICDHYGIELEGKHVVVVGRSLVIGKPAGMLALERNATVTFCHSRTSDLEKITNAADIVIAAIGKPKFFTEAHFSEDQIVIDVGINVVDDKICGDVDAGCITNMVSAITPVPGGVGTVATACLLNNVAIACTNIVR